MRIARKLPLLAMPAIAATALAVPSAFAQTEPELHNQAPRLIVAQEVHAATDVACPAVTPTPPPNPSPLVTAGGCRVHFLSTGVVPLTAHLSAGGTEVVVITCSVEFDARLDAAGEGWLSHHEFTGPVGWCTRQACAQPTPPTGEGRAYTIYLQEREVFGQGSREEAVILFCTAPLDNPAQTSHCEVTVPFTQGTTHRYRLIANDASGHNPNQVFPTCELSGQFDIETTLGTTGEAQAEQNVEIRHP